MSNESPDSGLPLFPTGTRVYIPSIETVGTIMEFNDGEYLVKFLGQKDKMEFRFFAPHLLIEQLTLPFEESPF